MYSFCGLLRQQSPSPCRHCTPCCHSGCRPTLSGRGLVAVFVSVVAHYLHLGLSAEVRQFRHVTLPESASGSSGSEHVTHNPEFLQPIRRIACSGARLALARTRHSSHNSTHVAGFLWQETQTPAASSLARRWRCHLTMYSLRDSYVLLVKHHHAITGISVYSHPGSVPDRMAFPHVILPKSSSRDAMNVNTSYPARFSRSSSSRYGAYSV